MLCHAGSILEWKSKHDSYGIVRNVVACLKLQQSKCVVCQTGIPSSCSVAAALQEKSEKEHIC